MPPQRAGRRKGPASAVRGVILVTQANSVPHPTWLKADLGEHGIYRTDQGPGQQSERHVQVFQGKGLEVPQRRYMQILPGE